MLKPLGSHLTGRGFAGDNVGRRRRRAGNRKAVAAVEFAVCLPVLVLLVFGSIEASSFIFLKQSLSVASYEGAREAAKSNSTDADAVARAEAILNSRGVNDFEVRFPEGVDGVERGKQIVCEVTAPTRTNSPLAGDFVANRNLTTRVVMLKE